MKKIFSALVLLSLLGVALLPMVVSAQGATGCTIRHTFTIGSGASPTVCTAGTCTFGTISGSNITADNPAGCSACCVIDLIYTITDWVFFITIALAILFIIIGAFMFITAAGSPEKTLAARNYLIYAAIGIIVALIAKAIPTIAKSFVGVT